MLRTLSLCLVTLTTICTLGCTTPSPSNLKLTISQDVSIVGVEDAEIDDELELRAVMVAIAVAYDRDCSHLIPDNEAVAYQANGCLEPDSNVERMFYDVLSQFAPCSYYVVKVEGERNVWLLYLRRKSNAKPLPVGPDPGSDTGSDRHKAADADTGPTPTVRPIDVPRTAYAASERGRTST